MSVKLIVNNAAKKKKVCRFCAHWYDTILLKRTSSVLRLPEQAENTAIPHAGVKGKEYGRAESSGRRAAAYYMKTLAESATECCRMVRGFSTANENNAVLLQGPAGLPE